jgi:ADP-ribose pyrophosphatase YjhB (NUDIX family)
MSNTVQATVYYTVVLLNHDESKILIKQIEEESGVLMWQIPMGNTPNKPTEDLKREIKNEIFKETGVEIEKLVFMTGGNFMTIKDGRVISAIFYAISKTSKEKDSEKNNWHWIDINNLPEEEGYELSKEAADYYKRMKNY